MAERGGSKKTGIACGGKQKKKVVKHNRERFPFFYSKDRKEGVARKVGERMRQEKAPLGGQRGISVVEGGKKISKEGRFQPQIPGEW